MSVGKILSTVLTVASVAAMLIPGGGTVVALGIHLGLHALVGVGLGLAAGVVSSMSPKPKVNQANVSRLTVSLDATAPRKIAFGNTALATDMIYGAYSGTNQDHFDQIVCVAAHQVQSIDEIWFDNQQAWTAAGGVTPAYSGYLSVDVRTVGTRANGIAIDGTWTANSTLTGCGYIHLRYKLTGNSSKATSPFSSSIPSRFTVRGKGALIYDPRLDSTVAGGSGTQRAADQTTWAWNDNASRNPALQLLFYLLGWRIQNPATGAWKLSVGRGIPAPRLDLPTFITAANVCDETITLAAGGTEPRYRSDGVFSEGDDPSTVLTNLLGAMNATLRDAGGKIALVCYTNDLGAPVASFTEADILGNESWEQSPPFNQIFNVVRGRYTNPSNTALYQLTDYPEAVLASPDGIDRVDTVDYSNVQSSSQAQRLAKQRLQRSQYQGKYTADFGARAWQVSLGQIVQLSHAGLGWAGKLFRVAGQTISTTGVTRMVLVEENAAIYAWSAEDSAPVTPGAPTIYNPLNDPLVGGIGDAAGTATWPGVTDPTGTKPADGATRDLVLTPSTVVAGFTVGPNNLLQTITDGVLTYGAYGQARSGAQFVEMDIVTVGSAWTILSLDDDNTRWDGPGQLSHVQFEYSTGNLALYGNNNATLLAAAALPAASVTGKLTLLYDGVSLIVSAGGVQRLSVAAPTGFSLTGAFYPKWWAFNSGVAYTGLRAGPAAIAPVVGGTIFDNDRVTVLPRTKLTNDNVSMSAGGTLNNGVANYSLTLSGVQGSFGTTIDNNALQLTGGGYLSNNGTTAISGMAAKPIDNTKVIVSSAGYLSPDNGTTLGTRLIANDTIGASAGKLTNVGAAAAALTIDDSLASLSSSGTFNNGAGGTYSITALDFANTAGATKPSDNAGTTNTLVTIGNFSSLRGNTLTKTGGTHGAHEGGCRSAALTGTASISSKLMSAASSASLPGAGWLTFLGLDASATNLVATSSTYMGFVQDNGGGNVSVGFYAGGSSQGVVNTTATVNSVLAVVYDGATVKVTLDGVIIMSISAAPGQTLYPKVFDFYDGGNQLPPYSIRDIVAGPWFMRPRAGSTLEDSSGTVKSDSQTFNSFSSMTPSGVYNNGVTSWPQIDAKQIANGVAEAGAEVTTGKSLDILADGATYARVRSAELAGGVPKVTVAGSGKKLGDARNLPNVVSQNLGYKIPVSPTYSAAAGTPATATISMAAFTLTNGSASISYNASSVGVSGTGGTIVTYYLYIDDPSNAGGSQTLHATTTGLDVYSADGRVFVGQIDVTYPTSGTGSGTGGGGGGVGAGGNCVTDETWLSIGKTAGAVDVGDWLDVADPRELILRKGRVSYSEPALVECVRIVTEHGSVLECSTTAPIATADGEGVAAARLLGRCVIIRAGNGWRSERVDAVEPIGERRVRHITCEDTYFLAGAEGHFFLHHNLKVSP